jgi:hypothetical protein
LLKNTGRPRVEVGPLALDDRSAHLHTQVLGERGIGQGGANGLAHRIDLDPVVVVHEGGEGGPGQGRLVLEDAQAQLVRQIRSHEDDRLAFHRADPIERDHQRVARHGQPFCDARAGPHHAAGEEAHVSAELPSHHGFEELARLHLRAAGDGTGIEGAAPLLSPEQAVLLEKPQGLLDGDTADLELRAQCLF